MCQAFSRFLVVVVCLASSVPSRLQAQENGRLKRSHFTSEAAWQVYDHAVKKLLGENRDRYSYKRFAEYTFFPNAKELQHEKQMWEDYFAEIQAPAEVGGKVLRLAESGAKVGDVVRMECAGLKPLVMVYVGEHRFPDRDRPYSFFIYPYSSRGGVELNTMPPRWSHRLMVRNHLIEDPKSAAKTGSDIGLKGLQFVKAANQQGLEIDWLKKSTLLPSVFLPTRWMKEGTTYQVLRPLSGFQFDRKVFLAKYEGVFGKLNDSQKKGLEQLLGFIEADPAMKDLRWVAYMLSTVQFECSNTWQPITELPPKGQGDEYFRKYDIQYHPANAKDLGNDKPGDGYKYRGRGYCQITGKKNYEFFSKLYGENLVASRKKALEPALSYKIMSYGMRRGKFTGVGLSRYTKEANFDYYNARAIINGDRDIIPKDWDITIGEKIRRAGVAFEKILQASKQGQ